MNESFKTSMRLILLFVFLATTSARQLMNLTRSGDPIFAICDTVAGGPVVGFNHSYPSSENPANAIDDSTSTKYLNYGDSNSFCPASSPSGIKTGFIVTPTISNKTVAVGLQFATAGDTPERDPITVTLEGSNATLLASLSSGASWVLIYNGATGINGVVDPGRNTYVSPQMFSNTLAFLNYRLLVTSKRGVSNSVQYSEANILGYY